MTQSAWPLPSVLLLGAVASLAGCGDPFTPPSEPALEPDPPEATVPVALLVSCPEHFTMECGSIAQCELIDPSSAWAIDLVGDVMAHSGSHQWQCDYGSWGLEMALDQDSAYRVHNWGGCDWWYPDLDGLHISEDDAIFFDAEVGCFGY